MSENNEDKFDSVESETAASINPYRSPNTQQVSDEGTGARRLGVVDWFLAIVLGSLAALFVFPTTCMGALILLGGLRGGAFGALFGNLVIGISCLASIAALFYVIWLVLRARSRLHDVSEDSFQ